MDLNCIKQVFRYYYFAISVLRRFFVKYLINFATNTLKWLNYILVFHDCEMKRTKSIVKLYRCICQRKKIIFSFLIYHNTTKLIIR